MNNNFIIASRTYFLQKKLVDTSGRVFTGEEAMGRAAMDYFKNIFTSVPSVDPSPIINLVQSVIDEDTNASLCADFTEKEISDALF